ncbi:hypothetical protein MNBD_ALPHA05-1486 [hydrothermal vent metagenome]|uniref:Metal-dependent HD superfamily phosphohydrolase n=1 Tax=hydrothermal vent metagenome TaxID=652676 RepID=A0A3B0SAG3_9ZZZZ
MVNYPIPDALSEHPKIFERLKARYSEAGRFYHCWTHIEQIVCEYDNVAFMISNESCVLYAIYYHDAIYDPSSFSNEEDSADLFRREILPIENEDIVHVACEFINATKTHKLPDIADEKVLTDCRYFLDLDMSILGADANEYKSYAKSIRREYSAYDDGAYCFGRTKILESFLRAERIFLTDYFVEKYERQANVNIKNELSILRSS